MKLEKISPMRSLAFGGYWAWIWLVFQANALDIEATTPGTLWVAVSLGNIMSISITMLLVYKKGNFRNRRTIGMLSAFSASIGSAILAFSNNQSVAIVGAGIAGAAAGVLVLLIGESFGSIPSDQSSIAVSLSWVITCVLFYIVLQCQKVLLTILIIALPLFIYSFLLKQFQIDVLQSRTEKHGAKLKRMPQALQVALFGFAIFSLVYSCLHTFWFSENECKVPGMGAPYMLGAGICALFVTITSAKTNGSIGMNISYRLILPFAIASLFSIALPKEVGPFFTSFAIGAGYASICITVWMILSDITYRMHLPGIKVFGLAELVIYAAIILSRIFDIVLGSFSSLDPEIISFSAMIIAVILSVVQSLIPHEGDFLVIWGLPGAVVDNSDVDSELDHAWESKCKSLAVHYQLSPRETEVMMMLAKGRSKSYIQDALYIAKTTVETHTKRIYSKLGIHSKQELITLVEETKTESNDADK